MLSLQSVVATFKSTLGQLFDAGSGWITMLDPFGVSAKVFESWNELLLLVSSSCSLLMDKKLQNEESMGLAGSNELSLLKMWRLFLGGWAELNEDEEQELVC